MGVRKKSYFNADGDWFDTMPNSDAGSKLKPLLTGVFAKLTTDAQLDALLHELDTQVCEGFNGLHTSIHPKRLDLSRQVAGRARHKLAIKRSNYGILSAARDVLAVWHTSRFPLVRLVTLC